MENLLIYIVQVNLLLVIIYVGYRLLLRGLTFYQLNRLYLLCGIVFSFVYPFLDVATWFRAKAPAIDALAEQFYMFSEIIPEESQGLSLAGAIVWVVGIGLLVFFIRLLVQLASLLRVHLKSDLAIWQSYLYRNVLFPIVPFSFFSTIYINREQHEDEELMDIFSHEKIHTRGLHTLDILLTEIAFITCWYNPVVWLMRKAVRQNLEFLTDQQVLNKGVDRQRYQYSLLNVSKQGGNVMIANQFNFTMLKRRIMMMNKKRSSKIELSKYAFLLPMLIFSAAAFTVNQVEANIHDVVDRANHIPLDVTLPKDDQPTAATTALDTIEIGTVSKKDTVNKNTIRIRTGSDTSEVLHVKGFKYSLDEKKPLLILDGEKVMYDEINHIDPNSIESITVLKDASSMALYGQEGEHGVLLITTKMFKAESSDSTKSAKVVLRAIGKVNDRKTTSLDEIKPLVVIDGVKKPAFDLNTLDADLIESIKVLKGENAEALYGDEGKNGVILVITKKGDGQASQDRAKGRDTSAKDSVIKEVVVIGYGQKKID